MQERQGHAEAMLAFVGLEIQALEREAMTAPGESMSVTGERCILRLLEFLHWLDVEIWRMVSLAYGHDADYGSRLRAAYEVRDGG